VHLITKSLLRCYLTRINFNFELILLNEICFINSRYYFFISVLYIFIWIGSAHLKFLKIKRYVTFRVYMYHASKKDSLYNVNFFKLYLCRIQMKAFKMQRKTTKNRK